ncbi:Zinc finger C2H2-type, partial [Trinorchestia longiramus]
EQRLATTENSSRISASISSNIGQTMHMQPDSSIACHICSKVFHGEYCKYNLKKHLTIHYGMKPFSCPLCQRTFNQKSSMRRHLTFVHGTDPDDLLQPARTSTESHRIVTLQQSSTSVSNEEKEADHGHSSVPSSVLD